jgi:hypothetical protein
MLTPSSAQTNDLAIALRHAGSLLASDPALAEQQALEILKPYPNDVNGLTLLGTALRLQRKFDAALFLTSDKSARISGQAIGLDGHTESLMNWLD